MRKSGYTTARTASDDDGDFFISFVVATTTDNWLLGYAAGGNLSGAILGDLLRDDDNPVITDLVSDDPGVPVAPDPLDGGPADTDTTPGESTLSY